jgi:tetratricopeptide (TPR) repeat protein
LGLGPVERVLIASQALWFYLGKLLVPGNLIFNYPRWNISAANPLAWSWLVLTMLSAIGLWLGRRKLGRGPEVAFVFFLAALSPMLGFITLDIFRYTFVADHFQYVACIGPLALVAAGLTLGLQRLKAAPIAQAVVAGALVAVCGLLTFNQARPYRNVEALWTDTLAKNPDSLLARRDLGRLLLRAGRFDEAIAQYRAAVRVDPGDVETLVSLGNAQFGLGRQDEAVESYSAALKINKDSPEAHANLGVIRGKQGRVDEAIQHNRRAVELNPNLVKVRVSLAAALAAKGEFAEAVQQYDAALKLNPDQPMAQINMAIALAVLGRVEEAAERYDKAATSVAAYSRRLEQEGRVDEAIAQLKEAMRLIPNNARSRYDLAMLYIRQGKPADARPHLNQALLLKPDFPEAKRALDELRDNKK